MSLGLQLILFIVSILLGIDIILPFPLNHPSLLLIYRFHKRKCFVCKATAVMFMSLFAIKFGYLSNFTIPKKPVQNASICINGICIDPSIQEKQRYAPADHGKLNKIVSTSGVPQNISALANTTILLASNKARPSNSMSYQDMSQRTSGPTKSYTAVQQSNSTKPSTINYNKRKQSVMDKNKTAVFILANQGTSKNTQAPTNNATLPFKVKQVETDNVQPVEKIPGISNTTPRWHVQLGQNYTMFLHSAFYDDRGPDNIAFVRIIAISDIEQNGTLYCDVWCEGNPKPYTSNATVIQGYLHKTNQMIYTYVKSRGIFYEYIFSCQLPKSNTKAPNHVSLRTNVFSQSDVRVPVILPEKPKTKIEVGVCVAISYGQIDFALFVEWVELNKMFGVKEFNVYFAYMTGDMKTMIEYYNTTGEVVYHSMPPVIPVPHDVKVAKPYVRLNSLPSLNHCLFTNMYRYTNIAVIDYDEVIVPREHMGYSQLIKMLNTEFDCGDSWVSYAFRNVYFFTDIAPDTSQPQYLSKIRYRHKAEISPYKKYPKSFINPRTCVVAGNHYCIKRFSGTLIYDVPPEIATSHHYRQCPHYVNCTDYMNSIKQDDILLKYKEQLIHRTKLVLEKLHYFT